MSVLALLVVALFGQTAATRPTIKDVGWIAGCWELDRNGRHIVEHWLPAEAGTMIGLSRTVAGGKTTEWEFLIIREAAAGLEYVAKPSGQPEGTFKAATATEHDVTFENPSHDFPKRILYKREGDALTAAIEGPINGQNRRIEFPYRKASGGG